jgi:hypothetical protein
MLNLNQVYLVTLDFKHFHWQLGHLQFQGESQSYISIFLNLFPSFPNF